MLKKGILAVFKTNVIVLLFNLITNFLLPKYLSVEAYASIKAFQLYVLYIGVFHFGYCDGVYLRYGGKTIGNIDKHELKNDVSTMCLYQLGISILVIASNLFIHDFSWLAFSVAILPLNMVSYYKLLCQATGEFTRYGNITNVTTVLMFAINIGLLFLADIQKDAVPYIVAYVVLDIGIWLGLEWYIPRTFQLLGVKGKFDIRLVLQNVKDGILLTLGNLSTALFTGMDRWFVKFLMDTFTFAQYSFAVSIESFLNVAVTPVSITLYNFFCKHDEREEIKKIKDFIIVFAALLPACAFPTKWILEHFLVNYIEATRVLFILFAAQTYGIIVKCIYINLYKARRQQRSYFVKLVLVLGAGFFLNAGCYAVLHQKEAFAIGTLISAVLWLVLSVQDFKDSRLSFSDWLYLALETCALIICGYCFGAISGFLVYCIVSILLTVFFMKRTINPAMEMLGVIFVKEEQH